MAVVLITGCSSGIGRASAARFVRSGHTVYATARRTETLAELAVLGCRTLPLDVTDEGSMVDAVAAVTADGAPVEVLVNNAGYGEYGTVEETPLDRVRVQFETNVFGLARMVQLVLPGMRAAGRGRIVNIGSMGGRLVFPAGGYYHASKYAVEALSDALRFEVAPFGIQVVLVEPGLIRSGFGETAAGTLSHAADASGPYAGLNAAADRQMANGYANERLSATPDDVAVVVERAATADSPHARYVVTPAARALIHTRRLLGAGVFDRYLRHQFRPSP
jgi:short-subunit dehydrogenase